MKNSIKIESISDFINLYNSSENFYKFFVSLEEDFESKKKKFLNFIESEKLQNLFLEITRIRKTIHNKKDNSTSSDKIHRKKANKRNGVVYTPKKTCRFIIERSLSEFLRINYGISKSTIGEKGFKRAISSIDSNWSTNLKILEPSCGLGFFLIDFLILLLEILPDKQKVLNILKTGFFGFDVDSNSIKSTQSALKLITLYILTFYDSEISTGNVSTNHPKNHKNTKIKAKLNYFDELDKNIDSNIRNFNFLELNEDIKDQKRSFDLIIGNPPYIRVHKIDTNLNQYLRANFYTPSRDYDIYICFFEQALKFLRINGVLGFITPEKYLLRDYAKKLRELMLSNTTLLEIIDVSRCYDVFPADIYPIITILKRKDENRPIDAGSIGKGSIEEPNMIFVRINQNFFDELGSIHKILNGDNNIVLDHLNHIEFGTFPQSYIENFRKNKNNEFLFFTNPTLIDLEAHFSNYSKIRDKKNTFKIFCGTPRAKDYKNLSSAIIEYDENKNEDSNIDFEDVRKYIVSRNILPFSVIWGIKINSISNNYQRPFFDLKKGPYSRSTISKFKSHPKIIIKANSKRITASIDRTGYITNGIYGIIIANVVDEIHEINPELIVSILNSDLINFYVLKKFQSYMLNSSYLSMNRIIFETIPLPSNKSTQKNEEISQFISNILRIEFEIEELMKKITSSFILNPQISSKESERNLEILKSFTTYPSSRKLENITDELSSHERHENNNQEEFISYLYEFSKKHFEINDFIFEMFEIPDKIRLEVKNFFQKQF